MTSPHPGSVSYLCPHCQARLAAQPRDAGQRRACPRCGQSIKVPGAPQASSGQPQAAVPVQPGIANIAFLCPACRTRLYAPTEQAGQTTVCPDCLETVTIPRPPAARPGSSPAPPGRVSRSEPPPPPARDRTAPDQEGPETSPLSGGDTDGEPQFGDAEPGVFAVKCPTCDTLLYATEDEIGQSKTCPDCFSIVEVKRPRVKPQRVNKVVDADYAGDLFKLSDPVPLDIYHQTELGLNPKTLGEEALRRAEQAYDERRASESELPPIPLWDGLFRFLPHPPMVVRLLIAALLLGGTAKVLMTTVIWANEGGRGTMAALFAALALAILVVVDYAYLGTMCLWILQESANGHDNFTDWPDATTPVEWLVEAFPAVLAVFYAILPGLGVYLAAGVLGMPASTRWLFLLVSLYLFLPIVQLSLLEADSLITPVSRSILQSLSQDFLLWATLYLMTFAIVLIVAIALSQVRLDTPTGVVMLWGTVWALGLFLYYRLLGRLAWACQQHEVAEPPSESERGDA